MNPAKYFDHASTTFLDPVIREAMLPWMGDQCGNAHSLHSWGRSAANAVEDARERLARALGAEDPAQIIFTSGATESNNWVAALTQDRLAVSPFEHSSMHESALHYGGSLLPNNGYQLLPPDDADCVAVMLVNNETGAILSPPSGYPVHADITQSIGKIALDLSSYQFASLSSHKFGGPKGVGILFAADPVLLEPLLHGGGQENGMRAGTLNVPGIVGLAAAAEQAIFRQASSIQLYLSLRGILLDELSDERDWHTDPEWSRSPAIVSISFPGLEGETLVVELDALGFAISSGAACSSRSTEPSHVLTALGYPEDSIRGTVRISFGPSNNAQSTTELARTLKNTVRTLRKRR